MALEKKIIGIPLAKGLNQKIADRVLPPGELTTLVNAQVVEGGELLKRKGFHTLSNTVPALDTGDSETTISVGKAIGAYGDEILAFDGRYGYTKTSASDAWVNKGTVVGCNLANAPIAADSNLIQTAAQITQSGAFEIHAWSEIDPTESVSRIVASTGATPIAPTTIGAVTYDPDGSPAKNDMSTGGTYTNTERLLYEVVINSEATPDVFQWRTQNDAGTWGSYATLNCTTTPQTLNEGVTVQFTANTGHTRLDAWRFYAGYGAVNITGATNHNFSTGSKISMTFAHADWSDSASVGDYTCTATSATSTYTLDFTGQPAPGATTTATGSVTGGQIWRTYAKVLDKTTRAEVVGKTLVNAFVTGNSIHNVPRAQIASIGNFVYIFVHVGSGRVKYTMLNTTDGVSTTLLPGLLTDDGSSTFLVDQTYPHWHVAPTNYINNSSSNGIVLFRRLDGGSSQTLRLSFWTADGSGTLTEKASSPAPVIITDAVHFHNPNLIDQIHTSEDYTGLSGHIEIAGGLMLSVVRPHGSANDLYIAVGYTKSIDGTLLGDPGTADEPGGVYILTYNSQLVAGGGSQLVTVDGITTAFTATTTANTGYVLVNGCASAGAQQTSDDRVRFFLTLVKNNTGFYGRAPAHLVNAYDYNVGGGTSITDKGLDIHGCTIASDSFYFNSDAYFTIAYATRHNSLSGSLDYNAFNNAVELLVNHQGEVVAKGANGAGSLALDINHRYLTHKTLNDDGDAISRRFNLMHSLPRAIGETSSFFRLGSSRYSGINTTEDGTDLTAVDASLTSIDMDPPRYLPSIQANGTLMLGGGILWNYSGDYFKEENFFWWPQVRHFTATSLSDAVDTGKHSWVAIYEWVDSNGKIQQSSPSQPIVHTLGADSKVTFAVYSLQLTYKKDATTLVNPGGVSFAHAGTRSQVKIVLYRTKVNKSIYFRCAETLMDSTAGYQDLVDTLPDSDLEDNPTLYTLGGILPNICPPSQYDISLWKDRVWLATTENTIWFSKRFSEDVSTEFSDFFIRSVDNKAEKITALCPNLEHLLIFGARNGYYLSGDGPGDAGEGPGFSPLRIFAPGQSAVPGSCRVETPVGAFFQSRQGLMLVGRNMQVTHKGAKADGHVSVANYLIDGHVFEDNHEVRFTSYDSGGILVYNYVFNVWSAWNLHTDLVNNAGSVVVGGTHYRLGVTGITAKQQTGNYNDRLVSADKSYELGFTTGWINVGQLQQLGRVYRLLFLGEFNAASKPTVIYYTDYNESGTAVEMDAAPGTSKFQLIFKLPKQKVKALKFAFTESKPGTGGVMAVQGVTLLVGIKTPGSSFKFPTADHIT